MLATYPFDPVRHDEDPTTTHDRSPVLASAEMCRGGRGHAIAMVQDAATAY